MSFMYYIYGTELKCISNINYIAQKNSNKFNIRKSEYIVQGIIHIHLCLAKIFTIAL